MLKNGQFFKQRYIINNLKTNFFSIIIKQSLIIIFLLFLYINFYSKFYNNKNIINNNPEIYFKYELDYEVSKFAIMKRKCNICGLFSFYKVFLSCIIKYIIKGFIPILEAESYPNVFNGYKVHNTLNNPWEYFFDQPYGYTYENVIKKGKNIKYINCKRDSSTPQYTNFDEHKITIDFWHIIARKYIPIKNTIIIEANNIINKLFNGSKNILGILIRGTDYIAKKPKHHPIPPDPIIVINDIKKMDKNNGYKWIFITTEDNTIRKKFIKEFGNKLKYIIYKYNIKYDLKKKIYLSYNDKIKGNLNFLKIYLINIIILSKCNDIITARTNGAVAAFILTEGFRNSKIYNLGLYP